MRRNESSSQIPLISLNPAPSTENRKDPTKHHVEEFQIRKHAPEKRQKIENGLRSWLRAIGLNVLSMLPVTASRKDPLEKEKVLMAKSRTLAFWRSGVHVLPVATSVGLMILNFNPAGVLLGPELSARDTLLLQFVAKMHEVAIVASLAAISIHLVRINLLNEQGLSLGLIGSAFSFSSMNFLWAAELWSALSFRKPYLVRRLPLLLFLLFACLLSATVGPASALLLVPSSRWWLGGGAEIYMRGEENQLWPNRLTKDHIGGPTCEGSPPVGNVWCLTGGFPQIQGNIMSVNSYTSRGSGSYYMNDQTFVERTLTIRHPDAEERIEGGETWSYTVHLASVWFLRNYFLGYDIAALAADQVFRTFGRLLTRQLHSNTKLPVVRTVCGPPSAFNNISVGDSLEFAFPLLSDNVLGGPGPRSLRNISIPAADIIRSSNQEVGHARWISLPDDLPGSTAAFAIISKENDTFAAGRGCTIDARWAKGQIYHDQVLWEYIIDQQKAPIKGKWTNEFKELKKFYSPTITADQDWLDAMNPPADKGIFAGRNLTNLEVALSVTRLRSPLYISQDAGAAKLLSEVVCLQFTDSLSRVGLNLQMPFEGNTSNFIIDPEINVPNNGHRGDSRDWPKSVGQKWWNEWSRNGKPFQRPDPSKMPTVALRFEVWAEGIGWQPVYNFGTILALMVLLSHILAAITYTLFTFYTGETSQTWDTLPELIALAYNSSPLKGGLANCGAGIYKWATLKRTVRIGVIEDQDPSDDKKVQMVVLEDDERRGATTLFAKSSNPGNSGTYTTTITTIGLVIRKPAVNEAYQ